jgi:hypothetical protein
MRVGRYFFIGVCFALLAASPSAAQSKQLNGSDDNASRRGATYQKAPVESFPLDITERRIVESDYKASTEVELSNKQESFSLRAGVAVRAKNINVLLRNVKGQVRFRATLEPVLSRVRARESSFK